MVSATQSPNGVSTFEKSFHDYGSNFGLYQLWWFLFSIIGLTLYFFHFLGYVVVSYFSITSLSFPYEFPLLHRTSADALLELVVLIGRWTNEVHFGKWSASDVVHHVGVCIGIYLVFYNQHCQLFAWLVCQLNTLHYPLFIWYFGCRKNCYSTSVQVQNFCKNIFPPMWLAVSSYRLSCLVFSTFWAWWADGNTTAGVCGLVFTLVLGYLDKNWTEFFLQDLSSHTIKNKDSLWQLLDFNVMYTAGTMLGFMTVFYF